MSYKSREELFLESSVGHGEVAQLFFHGEMHTEPAENDNEILSAHDRYRGKEVADITPSEVTVGVLEKYRLG